MVFGIYRLARSVKSRSKLMVNKTMIMMHIAAYFLIVLVNALQYMPVNYKSFRSFEISNICNYVVYFVCTLIFGLIVN